MHHDFEISGMKFPPKTYHPQQAPPVMTMDDLIPIGNDSKYCPWPDHSAVLEPGAREKFQCKNVEAWMANSGLTIGTLADVEAARQNQSADSSA